MFICGVCGQKFDRAAECWDHVEDCGELIPGDLRHAVCPECKGTGQEWRRDRNAPAVECQACRGFGERLRMALFVN